MEIYSLFPDLEVSVEYEKNDSQKEFRKNNG